MADPSDLKFSATDMKLVDYYLRNRVSTGKSGFITDIKLYEEEPWNLPHVNNAQFKDKEWFYFVTRTLRARKTPKRTVPGRGGSEGGTWTTTGKKEEILDKNKIVIGYKSELAYHKKINDKTKGNTTGWCMTEYWLPSKNDDDLFQEVVLCNIREKQHIAEQFRFHPQINNNIVEKPPQLENIDSNINTVSDPGVDSEIGLSESDGEGCCFDIDKLLAILDEPDERKPPALPQDMTPPLQDQEGDQDMDEYAGKLENMLEVEDDNDDDDDWLHHELGQDSRSRNNQLVFMEDACVDQGWVFNLDDQKKRVAQPQEQSNHYVQDSDIVKDQEMSSGVSRVTNNPYGYQMQEAAIPNGVNQDSSCSSATQEQGRKRRRT